MNEAVVVAQRAHIAQQTAKPDLLPLPPRRLTATSRGGFSLAELLVAMAIFITLMAGVAAVFVSSLNTVQQGYRSMDAFETGRSTLAVLEQDLKEGFTARDLGKFFQFFGVPIGFTMVGAQQDGQLHRITYVAHRTAGGASFETTLAERSGTLYERLVAQGLALGLPRDVVESHIADLLPPDPNAVVERRVRITTGGIVRYQESGADLDNLRLPTGMKWPRIHPTDFTEVPGGVENPNVGLYNYILSAITPDGSNALDLRNLARHPSVAGIRPGTILEILDARKRELWLRYVAGDLTQGDLNRAFGGVGFWEGINQDPRDYVVAQDIVTMAAMVGTDGQIMIWPDFLPETPLNVLFHPGYFFYANSVQEYSNYYNALANIQPALGLARFDASNPNHPSWNMLSYDQYMTALRTGRDPRGVSISPTEAVLRFDRAISDITSGTRLASDSVGSPLLPQLPYLVRPNFWVMSRASRPGGADFLRWFVQAIDIPASATRTIEANMTPNPNQL